MDLRLALYEIAAAHRLGAPAFARLQRLGGLGDEPAALARWLPRGVAVLAAALGGLGLVFWIAANWESLGRVGRFAVLQGFVLVMCVGALLRPAARAPLALLALLGIGGLFAYFGQTYQTGADAWQLFALWAVLALPLCLAVRSDVLWAPWVLVAMSAVSLWLPAHTGHRWRVEAQDLVAYLIAWTAALALAALLSAPLRRYTGAGVWSLRTALTLAIAMITLSALGGLFSATIAPHYALGLALLAIAAVGLSRPQSFDVYGLCAAALGLNALLVIGLARLLNEVWPDEYILVMLLLAVAAALLLAFSVNAVMGVARRRAAQGESA